MPNKSSVTKRSDRKPTKKVVRGGVGKTSSSMPKESLFKKDISLHLSERIGILRRLKHGWIRLYRRYKALFGKHTVVRFFTSVVLLVVIFFGIWAVLETIEYKVMEHRLNSLTDSIVDVLGEPDERAVTKGCSRVKDVYRTSSPTCGYTIVLGYKLSSKDTTTIKSSVYKATTKDSYLFNKRVFIGANELKDSQSSESYTNIYFNILPVELGMRCNIRNSTVPDARVDVYLECYHDSLFEHYPDRNSP